MEKEPLFCNLYFNKSYGDNNEYERYFIRTRDKQSSLTEIYCDGICFEGAIALLKSEKYPKYSQLCHVYRKDEENEINISFVKCTDKEGREILIKNDDGKFNDCIFCSFSSHRDYENHSFANANEFGTITFFKNSGI